MFFKMHFRSFFIVIFCMQAFVLVKGQEHQASTKDDYKAMSEELLKKYDENYIDDTLKKYDEEYVNSVLSKYDRDYIHKILFSKEIRNENLFKLYNKELFSFKVFSTNQVPVHVSDLVLRELGFGRTNEESSAKNVSVKVGLYVGDLIKLGFWGADFIMDKILYSKLGDYNTTHMLDKFDENIDSLKEFIDELSNKEDAFEDGMINNQGRTQVFSFIKKHYFLSYSSFLEKSSIQKLLFCSLTFELYRLFRTRFLLDPNYHNLGYAFKKLFTENDSEYLNNFFTELFPSLELLSAPIKAFGGHESRPIPLYNFFRLVTLKSKPLIGSISRGSHCVNDLCKYLVKGRLNTSKTEEPKIWWMELLDSYYILLIKEVIILTTSIKWLNNNLYQDALASYICENYEDFSDIVDEYSKSKAKYLNGQIDKKELLGASQKLKDFIQNSYDIPFKTWIKHKNKAFSKNEFWTNLGFNFPIYLIASKTIYEKFNEWHIAEYLRDLFGFKFTRTY